jgi:hypothetical protein
MKLIDRIGVDVGRRLKLRTPSTGPQTAVAHRHPARHRKERNAAVRRSCAGVRARQHGLCSAAHQPARTPPSIARHRRGDRLPEELVFHKVGASWMEVHGANISPASRRAWNPARAKKRVVAYAEKKKVRAGKPQQGTARCSCAYLAHTVEESILLTSSLELQALFHHESPSRPRRHLLVNALTSGAWRKCIATPRERA